MIASREKSAKEALKRAIEATGSLRKFAAGLGVRHSAVGKWQYVPDKFLVKAEEISGIPRHELRPDLYRGYILDED